MHLLYALIALLLRLLIVDSVECWLDTDSTAVLRRLIGAPWDDAVCLCLLQGWRSHLLRFYRRRIYGWILMPWRRNVNHRDIMQKQNCKLLQGARLSLIAQVVDATSKCLNRRLADSGGWAQQGPACQAILACGSLITVMLTGIWKF